MEKKDAPKNNAESHRGKKVGPKKSRAEKKKVVPKKKSCRKKKVVPKIKSRAEKKIVPEKTDVV